MADFSSRVLEFPARTAAIDTFLRDLRFRNLADISALQAAINDKSLFDELYGYWREREWVRPAPNSPMHVFPGENLSNDVTLREFCGEPPDELPEPAELPDGSA